MKIVIIGAGAMGCLYGAYLSRHNEVIMLDSYQPQVDAINKNGITIFIFHYLPFLTVCYIFKNALTGCCTEKIVWFYISSAHFLRL